MAVNVSLTGKKRLKLLVTNADDGNAARPRELGRREGRVRALAAPARSAGVQLLLMVVAHRAFGAERPEASPPACWRCGACHARPAPAPAPASGVHRLSSPGGHIEVTVRAAPDLAYDVSYDGKPLLADARLSLDVDHRRLGIAAGITGRSASTSTGRSRPPSA